MNKIERVRAALSGGPVDHPPFTVWYHFGLQHAPAERMARAHVDFFEAYDLAKHAARYLPDDPRLATNKSEMTDILSVTTTPPDASVFLTRYQPDAQGKFPPRQSVGQTPITRMEIARGDYLLQIEKPGHEPFQRMISSKLGRRENALWIRGANRRTELSHDQSGNYGIHMDSDAPI